MSTSAMPWCLAPRRVSTGRWCSRLGGFHVRLARERGLLLRANPWSEGDGLDLALGRGAGTAGDLDEFYGRAMPAGLPIPRTGLRPASRSCMGSLQRWFPRTAQSVSKATPGWSETHLVQAIARWPGGRAWYRVHEDRLGEHVRERTVADMIEQARAAGAVVRDEPPFTSVLVQASVTQTLGGLRIDARGARSSARRISTPRARTSGGIATGGYSSGLAAALVFGRIAAEEALS